MKINLDIKKEDIVIETPKKLGGDIINNPHWHIKALLGNEWPLIERLDEYSQCKDCELSFKVKVKVQTEFGEQEIQIKVPYEKVRPVIEEYSKENKND